MFVLLLFGCGILFLFCVPVFLLALVVRENAMRNLREIEKEQGLPPRSLNP